MANPLHVIVLAAGAGTRMRSSLPKVMQPVGNQSMIRHVLNTAKSLNPAAIHLVYGHAGERLREHLADEDINWVRQREQKGTGHAVEQALKDIPDEAQVLVLYGDVPLLLSESLEPVWQSRHAVLTTQLDDPSGYGRIIRSRQNSNVIERIVEEKDASSEEKAITEVNSGILSAPAERLRSWLAQTGYDNSQGEKYLTDVIALASADGQPFHAVMLADSQQVAGANTMAQLAELEQAWQQRKRQELLHAGVRMANPDSVQIRGAITAGRDVFLDQGVILQGEVTLGDGVSIGPYSVLQDCHIGNYATVHSHSVIEKTEIGEGASVGPFARLRPGTRLGAGSKVGNFVEIKKTTLGEGSKASHLTYLGDAVIGRNVNIGAGTITCNYDGVNKHTTVIEDGAFIGSDTQLVAPVRVGTHATIGAGTTLTRDAPAEQLTISRVKQRTIADWRSPMQKQSDQENN